MTRQLPPSNKVKHKEEIRQLDCSGAHSKEPSGVITMWLSVLITLFVCLPGFLVWHLQTGEIIRYFVGKRDALRILSL